MRTCRECGALSHSEICAACQYYRQQIYDECPYHGRGECDCR